MARLKMLIKFIQNTTNATEHVFLQWINAQVKTRLEKRRKVRMWTAARINSNRLLLALSVYQN